MVERDGQQPVRRRDGRRFRRPPATQALLRTAAAALFLLGGATSASAISGEDENTIELFGIDTTCPSTQELDALHICFESGDDETCDLFDVSTTGDILSTLLCPGRTILSEPDIVPETGPIDTGPILGSSTGYIRGLLPSGASSPRYAITHTFGSTVRTVEVAPGPGDVTPCPNNDGGAKISLFATNTGSEAFCSALAAALPKLGVSDGNVRFAIGYDYEQGVAGSSNFGGSDFMKVWACGQLNATCSNGGPSALTSLAGGGRVLEEIWLRTWLTETGLRIWR